MRLEPSHMFFMQAQQVGNLIGIAACTSLCVLRLFLIPFGWELLPENVTYFGYGSLFLTWTIVLLYPKPKGLRVMLPEWKQAEDKYSFPIARPVFSGFLFGVLSKLLWVLPIVGIYGIFYGRVMPSLAALVFPAIVGKISHRLMPALYYISAYHVDTDPYVDELDVLMERLDYLFREDTERGAA